MIASVSPNRTSAAKKTAALLLLLLLMFLIGPFPSRPFRPNLPHFLSAYSLSLVSAWSHHLPAPSFTRHFTLHLLFLFISSHLSLSLFLSRSASLQASVCCVFCVLCCVVVGVVLKHSSPVPAAALCLVGYHVHLFISSVGI